MGIYDRDYYRDDEPRGGNPWLGQHSAMKMLLILNGIVFFLWLIATVSNSIGMQSFMAVNFMVSVDTIKSFRAWTLITYAFSHIDIWHIVFNMLFLWIFGRLVEDRYGPRNMVFLYIVAGLAAAVLYLVLDLAKGAGFFTPMLGASGAVMGLTIVAAFLHPNMQIYIWGILPIRLKWLAMLFILTDVLGMVDGKPGTVANSAHLGGALMGFLFYWFDLRPFDRPGRTDVLQWFRGLFRRKPNLRIVARPKRREEVEQDIPRTPGPDSDTAARVDELLAKIGREGMQSLSTEEKRFLEEASRHYRDK